MKAAIAVLALVLAGCQSVVVVVSSPSPAPVASQAAGADVCHVGGVVYCALNPAVTDANVRETICNRSWTRGLRPPESLTERWKRDLLAAYPQGHSLSQVEGDHRMPEADLGGDPGASLQGGQWVLTSQTVQLPTGAVVPANYSDEFPASPNPKDGDETALHDQVCAGQLTLTAARIQLRDRWLGPFPGYKG